ncbi:MAG: type I restriction enzyme HsdR N-terminal domain-containing protein [Thermodesulfobacteriota bacterium]
MSDTCSFSGEYLRDYLTGRRLPETDDEQIRQKIERLLVEEKGWDPLDLEVDHRFQVSADGRTEAGRAELVAFVGGRPFMTIRNSRGSIGSRETEAVAASRLAFDEQVPLTVVTNGREAELIDTLTGKVLAEGLEAIPAKETALAMAPGLKYEPCSEKRRLMASRIYLAYATIDCAWMCGQGL